MCYKRIKHTVSWDMSPDKKILIPMSCFYIIEGVYCCKLGQFVEFKNKTSAINTDKSSYQ